MGINGYKGLDANFQCRGHQYEVGKTYEEPSVKICERGFHFCENPLDVWSYYGPTSRFAEVEGDGQCERHSEDSKVACTKLHIKAEISLKAMIEGAVKFVFERTTSSKETTATTGNWANAATTGYKANAATTGEGANAAVSGKDSIAAALGISSKAKGALGCWIVLTEWAQCDSGYHIQDVQSVKVDGERILADTWYRLIGGQFVAEEV